jgi:diguanylate cyclase (GGDEF)-like protein
MTRRDPWRGSSTPMALLQRIRTARPFPYRRGFMVGCMALMWAAGGLTVLATCVLFPTPGLDRAAAVTIGLLALLISAGVAAFGTRMPDWAFPTVSVGGAAVVAALMVAGGGGVTSVAFSVFLLWVVLYALLFFPGPVAAMVVTTAGAAFGVAFVVLDDVPVLVPLVLLSTFGITGVVVASLTRARDAAATDALTGLANRRGFDLALEHAIRRAEVDGHPVCVAVLDVDRFKQVNERYGGDAADRLLRAVAERWRELLPIGSFLGRLGGDEFAIVLPGLAADAAEPAVDRLRAATPAGVTASAGVTAWRSGDSLSMLLGRAEAALYEAKRAGRDRTWVTRDDSRAVAELRRAIRSDELLLHYQPKASLRTGRIVGFEALVRWQHPERGLLPPSEFIRLAEDSGCIVELGAWVLDTAIRQAAAWRAAHPDHHIEVAANVAGRQLDDEDFLDRLSASLHRHALPASRLCLEVTESMLSEDLDRWVEVLTGARRLGVQVAMDDFGTGYSSLHQLRHLPVNVIKIDRAFVGDLADSADARTLVTA